MPSAFNFETTTESSARLWRYFMAARLLVALGLLAWLAWAQAQGQAPLWLLLLCAAYLVSTAAVLRWSHPAQADSFWAPGWLLTLWVDLAFFGLLQWTHGGSVNYMPLFVLPVLLAAVLGPLRLALGSAAFATLVLLFDAVAGELLRPQHAATYAQGAISGAGLFLVALLVHQLAQRLGREQAQASSHRAMADAQAQVNQIIATGLSEGVLVIDARGQIWHANPAACAMLGAAGEQPPYPLLPTLPAWPLLSSWARALLLQGSHTSCTMRLPRPSGEPLQVQLRAHLNWPAPGSPAQPTCVIFMESLRDIEARIRTEKLAAMGRVSAAVAHEIRNPLAAISQANALLAEEALQPAQQRLSLMIGHNAKRLSRTVDDILELARQPLRPDGSSPSLSLDPTVAALLAEWLALNPQAQLEWLPGAPQATVAFEAEHLRRVLVNLLDNALRHAADSPQPLQLATRHGSEGVQLEAWNPGPPMPAEVEAHLFEPFNSSHSRSSGLGLYLARQLCQRHGAQLDYWRADRAESQGHAFVLRFAAPASAGGP
ncbi:signal transduction histidine kinase [Serpentinimonas maccroryi]|uniref:histidine kinase n=1 Tax=Serpentinimonas maccroryi TaxID=1458426 RepID=A0A060NQP1_9BURK|nr:ATP-binding protein [Serpentinimonas maccroryi]MCM2478548.1 PAS domain-containing protein [Serpentinimonas maccroryi]BAO83695.1 signal transduction histidine kinase [Serpentinimonas maccroryi]